MGVWLDGWIGGWLDGWIRHNYDIVFRNSEYDQEIPQSLTEN